MRQNTQKKKVRYPTKKKQRKKWKSTSEYPRQKQNHCNESKREAKSRANVGERGARGREAKREQRESARARGEREREKRKFGSGELTDGTDETDQRTNERTNERMSVWDGVSNQTLETCDVIMAAHIVHLITNQNLDQTVKNFPQKI